MAYKPLKPLNTALLFPIDLSKKDTCMICCTSHTVDGYTIDAYLGLVCADSLCDIRSIINKSSGKQFIKSLAQDMTKDEEIEFLLEEARTECLTEIMEKASIIGADALIGLNFSISKLDKGLMLISAHGTAVGLKKIP